MGRPVPMAKVPPLIGTIPAGHAPAPPEPPPRNSEHTTAKSTMAPTPSGNSALGWRQVATPPSGDEGRGAGGGATGDDAAGSSAVGAPGVPAFRGDGNMAVGACPAGAPPDGTAMVPVAGGTAMVPVGAG